MNKTMLCDYGCGREAKYQSKKEFLKDVSTLQERRSI